MESLFASTFNLALLIAGLVYKLRGPLREFVVGRHHLMSEELQSVRDQMRAAQEKYDEFSSKLKAVDSELAALREQYQQDALLMKQRIVSEARRISGFLVSDARNTAENLFSQLKGELYSELSFRVLDRAELLLRERLTRDDQVRMRQEFSRQMENV